MLLYAPPGPLDWADSQLIYHALADLGQESLCLVRPNRPYVCLGFSQEPARELDLEFCARKGLPLFRRELGGGLVLLDQNQVFFQVVLRRDHPLVHPVRELFYRRLLEPAIRAYNRMGVPARFRPLNDISFQERKLSGTGAGEIGECVVFAGNIILDFDSALMARITASPSPAFRKRVELLMARSMGSLRGILGPRKAREWTPERIAGLLEEEFSRLLGPLEKTALDQELAQAMAARKKRMLSPKWIQARGRRARTRRLKIRSGLELVQETFSAPNGPITALFEVRQGRIRNVGLEGGNQDFLDSLRAGLEGLSEAGLAETMARFQDRDAGPTGHGQGS